MSCEPGGAGESFLLKEKRVAIPTLPFPVEADQLLAPSGDRAFHPRRGYVELPLMHQDRLRGVHLVGTFGTWLTVDMFLDNPHCVSTNHHPLIYMSILQSSIHASYTLASYHFKKTFSSFCLKVSDQATAKRVSADHLSSNRQSATPAKLVQFQTAIDTSQSPALFLPAT